MAWSTPSTRSTSDLITAAIWNQDIVNNPIALLPATISFFIDGGGAVLPTGVAGSIEVPFKCDIDRATLLVDQTGDVVIDIWKDTYANYPPTDADSITAAAPPTIVAGTKDQDSTLTGWTTNIAAGSVLYFNVDSVDVVTWCLVALKVSRS